MKAKSLLFLQGATIVLAGWFVFSPVFRGSWLTDWDDGIEITRNIDLRDSTGLWNIWFAPHAADYFPLKSTVQWLEWHLWQDNPAGYHLTNVALHMLSAFLLWRLLSKLGVRLAWVGGLLFTVHPLAVESVAWISELKNVLSLPLMLLAMIAFVDYDERKYEGRRTKDEASGTCASYFVLLTSYFLFLAAMLCKTSVVMFPTILLLYAWWKRGRIARSDVLASIPFFVVSLALGLLTVSFQYHRALAGETVITEAWHTRAIIAGLAVAFYFLKSVFPIGLLPLYPRWTASPPSLPQLLPWFLLAAALWGLVRLNRRPGLRWPRHVLFGLGFFLLNLIPVLGFVPMSFLRLSWVADHFAYLPLVGVVGLAAAGMSESTKDEGRKTNSEWYSSHFIFRPSYFVLSFLSALLAIESRHYAAVFATPETLWTYTLHGNPGAWIAHNNLGNTLFDEGRVAEATDHYEQALKLKPDYPEAHNNLGNLLAQAGRVPEAIAQYEKALQVDPRYPQAENGLGNSLARIGRMQEAIEHLKLAIGDNPDYAEAHNSLANVLMQAGRFPEAAAEIGEALRLNPDYAEARNNLGNLLFRSGRTAEAIAQYEQALRLRPGFPEAHNNLGNALISIGRLQEGASQIEEALRLRPGYAEAHFNLGLVLARTDRAPEAIAQFKLALQLRPDFPEAREHLATLENTTH